MRKLKRNVHANYHKMKAFRHKQTIRGPMIDIASGSDEIVKYRFPHNEQTPIFIYKS